MTLHVVEPTLSSYAGHCHSLVEAIVQNAPDEEVFIWAGKGSEKYWHAGGYLKPYFYAPIRKLQIFVLYRRLLRQTGKLLISTAGSIDFMVLDLVARKQIPKNKVFLFIHWLGSKMTKTSQLTEIAKRQPNLEVLCPTQDGANFFELMGFRARCVPYPQNDSKNIQVGHHDFHHLVVAGAARLDKGFESVVDLVEYLALLKTSWPIHVQVSATHHNKHSLEMRHQIERLEHSRYLHLTLLKDTLSPEEYKAQFLGGISVQPYSADDFRDRVSGVTLDALSMGCPVIVTADTWLSKVILQYQAGVSTSDLSPYGLRVAIQTVLSDYDGYCSRAFAASEALKEKHSAEKLMEVILKEFSDDLAIERNDLHVDKVSGFKKL